MAESEQQSPYKQTSQSRAAELFLNMPRKYKHFRLSICSMRSDGQEYAVCRGVPQQSMPDHLKACIPLNHGIIVKAERASAYSSYNAAARAAEVEMLKAIDVWIKRTEKALREQADA